MVNIGSFRLFIYNTLESLQDYRSQTCYIINFNTRKVFGWTLMTGPQSAAIRVQAILLYVCKCTNKTVSQHIAFLTSYTKTNKTIFNSRFYALRGNARIGWGGRRMDFFLNFIFFCLRPHNLLFPLRRTDGTTLITNNDVFEKKKKYMYRRWTK